MRHVGRQLLKSARPGDSGSVLAESALVLPVLLLFLMAMAWFGMLIYSHIVVQSAANQGARAAAAAYAQPTAVPPEQRGQAVAVSILQGGSLSMDNVQGIQVQHTQLAGQDVVRVTVAYNYALVMPFMDRWGAGTGGVPVVHFSVYRVEVVH